VNLSFRSCEAIRYHISCACCYELGTASLVVNMHLIKEEYDIPMLMNGRTMQCSPTFCPLRSVAFAGLSNLPDWRDADELHGRRFSRLREENLK
jgi:hypothetical protein